MVNCASNVISHPSLSHIKLAFSVVKAHPREDRHLSVVNGGKGETSARSRKS